MCDRLNEGDMVMLRVEFHPGEGGDDAGLFAGELASAVGRHVGGPAVKAGRLMVVETSERL